MKLFGFFAIFTVMMAELNAMAPTRVQVGEVVSGELQNWGTFPYVAHLNIYKVNAATNMRQTFTCGGSIIRLNIILTAAHCVEGALPQNVEATAGIVHTGIVKKSQQTIVGRRIVTYEDLRFRQTNDIALVFLKREFKKSNYVDIIPIASLSQYYNGMNVTAIGWGRLTGESQEERLHHENFIMALGGNCLAPENDDYRNYNYDKYLCVYDKKGYTKRGSGDSGGPLVYNSFLVGVSVGNQRRPDVLDDPVLASIFINVGSYENWILHMITYDNSQFQNYAIQQTIP